MTLFLSEIPPRYMTTWVENPAEVSPVCVQRDLWYEDFSSSLLKI
jgi:hypothetical protein